MFGYVTINKPEMKFKEYDVYHAYYCGVCRSLKNNYGYTGQLSLNYDLTFVAILLSHLYDVETKEEASRCIAHPLKKYNKYFNECIDYAASMTIVLSYYKCQDDWIDERKVNRQLYKQMLKRSFHKIEKQYPDKVKKIGQYLDETRKNEQKENQNLDEMAKYSGYMMGEVCAYKDDIWHDDLYEFGFYLGKFIYFMDAYDDIEGDIKKGLYNPLIDLYNQEDFNEKIYDILESTISKAALAFECLPIIENVEILRNILYSGIWSRFEYTKKRREERE